MFRHVGIVIKDINKQLKFYKELLGLEIYYEKIERGYFLESLIDKKDVEPLIFKLGKEGKTIVELLYFNNSELIQKKDLASPGITHFAITVEDIDSLYKKMKEAEINFLNQPQISDDGKFKVCFCQDYELNFLELVQVL